MREEIGRDIIWLTFSPLVPIGLGILTQPVQNILFVLFRNTMVGPYKSNVRSGVWSLK